jgi:hypothetical protein
MNPVSRKLDNESKKLIKEYLDNGGVITQCPGGQRSEEIEFRGGFYTKRKKKKEEKEDKNE